MEVAEDDVHRKEVVERSGEGEGVQLREPYHDGELLVDFLVDEHSSVHSHMDVGDRITYLEQRMQMQEDEIQLLKIALADVLKRLNISEAQTAALTKRGSAKARPVSLASPSKTASNNAASLKKGSTNTLPSSTSSRNYSPILVSKRNTAGGVKDTSGTPTRRVPVTTSTTTTACKKLQESNKPKESNESVVGTRRVTHCKVTMQIYLSPQSKRIGPTNAPVATAVQPHVYPSTSGPPPEHSASRKSKPGSGKKTPSSLSLHKRRCQGSFSPSDTPTYKSPIKSPSQYFQICY